MKITKHIFGIFLIMLTMVICNSCICYGVDPIQQEVLDEGSGGAPAITETEGAGGGSDFTINYSDYRPAIQNSDSVTGNNGVIPKILGILQLIGVSLIVVSGALIGFNTILGSASEKAINQEKFVGLVIAAMILTAGTTLAKFLIDFAENI